MNKITLGSNCKIDLSRLIETRLLVQANSGGGKSYLIRKLLEEAHGQVQQIVLDIEGEFGSLRSKFDYIIAGKGGDVSADPKTAELLARKLLELGADCIIDLYELKSNERHRFVRLFLESLMNAPKDLWRPVLIVVDEAHLFAPEKGQSEAMSAVIDLATRGRKREFAAVLATQRISKLHKDAAAECLNKLIGRTGLDIDMKRAADELGFTTRQQQLSLRDLDPGEFFTFGPALSKEVAHIRVGEVSTAHGKAARTLMSRPTVPTARIKQMLSKLTDLPKKAEEELRDRGALQKRVQELEKDLKGHAIKTDPKKEEQAYQRGLEEGRKESLGQLKRNSKLIGDAYVLSNRLNALLESTPYAPIAQEVISTPTKVQVIATPFTRKSEKIEIEGRTFGQCERKILGFLSLKPGQYFTKVRVGVMTGYSHGSGGFNNAVSNLSKAGLILRSGSSLALNPDVDVSDLVDSTPHRLEDWISKLGACERAIYSKLLEDPEKEWPKEEMGEATGYSAGSGGFNNSLSRLSTLGLLCRKHGGAIALNPEVLNL